jgi:hypothetical protein
VAAPHVDPAVLRGASPPSPSQHCRCTHHVLTLTEKEGDRSVARGKGREDRQCRERRRRSERELECPRCHWSVPARQPWKRRPSPWRCWPRAVVKLRCRPLLAPPLPRSTGPPSSPRLDLGSTSAGDSRGRDTPPYRSRGRHAHCFCCTPRGARRWAAPSRRTVSHSDEEERRQIQPPMLLGTWSHGGCWRTYMERGGRRKRWRESREREREEVDGGEELGGLKSLTRGSVRA